MTLRYEDKQDNWEKDNRKKDQTYWEEAYWDKNRPTRKNIRSTGYQNRSNLIKKKESTGRTG